MPYDVLARISTRITNEVADVNRVVLDVKIEQRAVKNRQPIGPVEVHFRRMTMFHCHESLAYPVRVFGTPNAA